MSSQSSLIKVVIDNLVVLAHIAFFISDPFLVHARLVIAMPTFEHHQLLSLILIWILVLRLTLPLHPLEEGRHRFDILIVRLIVEKWRLVNSFNPLLLLVLNILDRLLSFLDVLRNKRNLADTANLFRTLMVSWYLLLIVIHKQRVALHPCDFDSRFQKLVVRIQLLESDYQAFSHLINPNIFSVLLEDLFDSLGFTHVLNML